jgi:hypothetical protein
MPEDWVPDSMNPAHKAKDSRAVALIQGYDDGGLFGHVVAVPGVTLNGQPVKLLVLASRGQARDLLDHTEMVESVGQFVPPRQKPPVNLNRIIKRQLARRSVEVD